uniref:Uncharacterized protein n=1 Tax=Oryza glaberrima TaxID=4538 RepID=I1R5Z6_ORYGL
MASMDCTWHELVTGLVEEPALSLSVLEPGVGVGGGGGGGEGDNGGVFFVSPAGVVEQVGEPAGSPVLDVPYVATNVV